MFLLVISISYGTLAVPFEKVRFLIEQKEAAAPDSGRRSLPVPVSLSFVKI